MIVPGKGSKMTPYPARRAVGMPSDPIFTVTRDADAEWKLLEYLSERLTPDSSGTVDLYSENEPCPSCRSVIAQFKQRFPGVVINVSWGG
jgi:The  BURPS668_1122 family of deaminases